MRLCRGSNILRKQLEMKLIFQLGTVQPHGLKAGSHFDISISISINISIRKICVNRGYMSISVRMAIAQAQFTSYVSNTFELCARYFLRVCTSF